MKIWIVLFVTALLVISPSANAEFNSIDEMVKAYSDESCKNCHKKIYDEWQSSYHSQSVVHSLGGIKNFITVGLVQEYKQPLSKEHLMRCMDCHAPMIGEASETLAKEIADLIVTAAEGKDEKKAAAAKAELGKLNVNCVVCHNTKISVERNLRGEPKKGVYYGPAGAKAPHGTEKSVALKSSLFCGQCHGIYTPDDGDTIVCNTLYGSYQDAYRGNGGSETCQDCHMKKADRGHTFPGAYQAEIVKEGITVDFQAIGIKMHPGKWIPTAIVDVSIMNKAGHRIPDG